MNRRHLLAITSTLLLAPATQALAEAGTRQDNSYLLVWGFLGMCALIVIIQLMPVAMIAYGLVKGLLKGKEETPAEEVATHK